MRYPKLNVRLLKKILAAIKAAPDRFDMGAFFAKQECGTTMCIGGWALLLSSRLPRNTVFSRWFRNERHLPVFDTAVKRLGLTETEGRLLMLRHTGTSGPYGVMIAERKINALIEDREQFARTFNRQFGYEATSL